MDLRALYSVWICLSSMDQNLWNSRHFWYLQKKDTENVFFLPVTFPRICLIDLFVGCVTLTSPWLAPFYHLAGFQQCDRWSSDVLVACCQRRRTTRVKTFVRSFMSSYHSFMHFCILKCVMHVSIEYVSGLRNYICTLTLFYKMLYMF